MLILTKEQLNSFDAGIGREWLVTNGLGGYASSTVIGANTRRYHGLLIAALDPPVRRTLMLYKMDEEVEVDGQSYPLSSNEFHDRTVSPLGFHHLQEFRLDDNLPVFTFTFAGATLDKTIWMEYGQNTTYIRYTLRETSQPAILRLRLLTSYRDHHGVMKGKMGSDFRVVDICGGWEITASREATPLRVLTTYPAHFEPIGSWHWDFLHRRELERGLEYLEDAYCPGTLVIELEPGESVTVAATTEEPTLVIDGLGDCLEREKRRHEELMARSDASDAFSRQLVLAADRFIVAREPNDRERPTDSMHSVVAGYHWFTDWGRDCLIGLPGLFLSTGRFAEVRLLLKGLAEHLSEGMLPNYFPEDGAPPMYNAVDTALWYFYAMDRYLSRTGDLMLVDELYPKLEEIIERHLRGTRYSIAVDQNDGLLHAGEEGVQLTWMDAKVNDWVVTARCGKPIEINALWYNALASMSTFARQTGKSPGSYVDLAQRTWSSFNEKFWNAEGEYLYDVVDCHLGQDASFRPNQILSISLPYPVLRRDRWKIVVDKVRERLLTPLGLRTLPRNDPMYVGWYIGDQRHRDVAYHQGTVWPWLIGPFVDAYLKVYGDKAAARQFLSPFEAHLMDAGVGFIGEIFDGDWPHGPQGCIAQAWSVAEVLRAWLATR